MVPGCVWVPGNAQDLTGSKARSTSNCCFRICIAYGRRRDLVTGEETWDQELSLYISVPSSHPLAGLIITDWLVCQACWARSGMGVLWPLWYGLMSQAAARIMVVPVEVLGVELPNFSLHGRYFNH